MDSPSEAADWQAIGDGNYLCLATRQRSGRLVETPVWSAPLGDNYVVFSAGKAGKVKRLKNFSDARIAACTLRGKITGPWVEASAYLLDAPADKAAALQALRKKYGWLMWTGDIFSALVGKKRKRAYIRIECRR